ncbi:DNA topoisomerase IB [Dongia sedimenti]|uniref:DNA topoisomerase n=1 Tax=Dongia sedimenti TaxID=3064282 RepID=A0ABU0YSI2_9PROT|nr:DNA topoisomerase IB [Rhodospirillaceae bacterium R-7]
MDGTSLIVEAKQAAKSAGLRYASDEQPGIRRKGVGKGFRYLDPDGKPVKDPKTLKRIRALSVPPAWTDVWICPLAEGHIQATGRDAKGRKQYRYHADFRAVREDGKYEHMLDFAKVLPQIREAVSKDMARRDLSRECVLATVVHLLETTLIRVGNDEYAKQNKSYGLTTLRMPHVKIEGSAIRFQFLGKSGKTWRLQVNDRRVAKIVRACQDLPGQQLFQYLDAEGNRQGVTSSDVNAYLREIAGSEITAKDFRTWAGTVLAAVALQEFSEIDSQAKAKRNLKEAIESVASRLGNTVTICRKCYIHPEVINGYLAGDLASNIKDKIHHELSRKLQGLKPEEAAVLALLERRLKLTLSDKLNASVALRKAA